MFKASSVLKAGVATAAISALALGGAVSANADPYRTYAAVGSDTTQDVWNGLTNAATPAVANVASYDAFPTGTTIKTKSNGVTFLRPSGSGNGVKALSAAWDSTNHIWSGTTLSSVDVDFARSSSKPAASTPNQLTYIPFARDAVSVAYNPVGTETTINFTAAQLKELYSGVDDTSNTVVTFSAGVPQVNGHAVQPKLPQSGSGTRSFFLSAAGVTTLGSYVEPTASTLAENDGAAIANDGDLIPFSAAQWVAQKNGVATNTTGANIIASIGGSAAVTVSGSTYTAGPLYGDTTLVPTGFARDTYNVIPTTQVGTELYKILTGASTAVATAKLGTSASNAVVATYGFKTLGYFGQSSQNLTGPFVH